MIDDPLIVHILKDIHSDILSFTCIPHQSFEGLVLYSLE